MVMYGATVIIYLLIVWTLSNWSDVSLYTYGVRTGTVQQYSTSTKAWYMATWQGIRSETYMHMHHIGQ